MPLGRHKNKNTQNYFQHFIRTTSCITARMIWSLVYKSFSLAPWLLTNKASLMHKQMHCNNLREEASCPKVTWTHTEVSINCYFLSDGLSLTLHNFLNVVKLLSHTCFLNAARDVAHPHQNYIQKRKTNYILYFISYQRLVIRKVFLFCERDVVISCSLKKIPIHFIYLTQLRIKMSPFNCADWLQYFRV